MPKSFYRTAQSHQILMEAYNKALERFPVPYESCMIPTRFGNVHALVAGAAENPPLFLIHGATSNATVWQPNVATLSQHFRLYMFDIPGDAGKSMPVSGSGSGQQHVKWLVDVLDNLNIEKVHLGGVSLGGWISLIMALRQPQRVERLVLLAPALFLPVGVGFISHALLCRVFTSRQTIGKFLRYMSAPGTPFNEQLCETFYLMVKHFQPSLYIPAGFRRADLARITNPVLFMVGEYEVLYNPQKAVARAQSIFPNVQTQLIPDAGHQITWEQPQLVNQAIINFLGAAT